MKKALVILLCALAVFAIVSCKQDPPKPETFKVTFDSKGGSTVATANVEKDAKVEKPENPIKMGNIFYNWYTEEALENIYDFETPVTADITLYAKWIPTPANEVQTFKMTAGRESDRFQFQWIFGTAIKAGDVISFKYKSNRVLDKMTNREMSKADTAIEKLCSDVAITGEPDAEGWYTFSYTIPATDVKGGDLSADAKGIGVALLTKDGNTKIGEDYIYLKEITYTSGTTVTTLSLKDENRYSGAKGPIETSFIRLVATKGTDGVDDHKYSQDKFTLYWNPNVQVNPGDVLTLTFKAKRNDPLTEDRDFTYSLRDAKKWFSEVGKGDKEYPQFWSTMSDPDLEGWITVTYVFPDASAATKEAITYPATFRVDFRDTKIASPSEGREADIVYLRSATITTKDPEDPLKTITTALVLDKERVAGAYSCPTVEEFFFPAE
jgi:uncharacterized repeat protein (TIGR02543 family)